MMVVAAQFALQCSQKILKKEKKKKKREENVSLHWYEVVVNRINLFKKRQGNCVHVPIRFVCVENENCPFLFAFVECWRQREDTLVCNWDKCMYVWVSELHVTDTPMNYTSNIIPDVYIDRFPSIFFFFSVSSFIILLLKY